MPYFQSYLPFISFEQFDGISFITEELLPINTNISAASLWKEKELSHPLIFTALSQLLYKKGFIFTEPSNFPLFQGKHNLSMSIFGNTGFLDINLDDNALQLLQIKNLFKNLYTEECMKKIIQHLFIITALLDENKAALLKSSLKEIKHSRLKEICNNPFDDIKTTSLLNS